MGFELAKEIEAVGFELKVLFEDDLKGEEWKNRVVVEALGICLTAEEMANGLRRAKAMSAEGYTGNRSAV